MTDCKLKEAVIREVKIGEKSYLLKEDVIDLLLGAAKCSQSLSSKNDIENLAKALMYGEHE